MFYIYTFDEIKGNEQLKRQLKNAVLNKRISHSYIIDAPKGMGKKLIAKTFAKTLQCLEKGTEPCGKCVSCRTFDEGNHTDIIYVKAKGKSIGVDDIREQIVKNIELRPYQYPYKIFIVENADTMTIQAQNALLKTIEEPPEYGLFILLSNNYTNFLPTILSRCVMFRLKPLRVGIVSEYLINKLELDVEKAYMYALYSQGNIGRAVEMAASEEFAEMREMAVNLTVNLFEHDLTAIFSDVEKLSLYKNDIQQLLDIIYLCYRDATVVKAINNSENFLIQKDKKYLIEKIASKASLKSLVKKSEAVFETKMKLKQNASFQMAMEAMLLRLKEN